jgi:hypothetical protein
MEANAMLSPVVQTRPGVMRARTAVRHTLYVVRWEGATPSYSVESAWPVAPNATVLFKVVHRERAEALSTAAWMCAEIAHARAVSLAH